jgi:hypothetical protein
MSRTRAHHEPENVGVSGAREDVFLGMGFGDGSGGFRGRIRGFREDHGRFEEVAPWAEELGVLQRKRSSKRCSPAW